MHGTQLAKRSILGLSILTLLAGCGQVAVFGHVVGERPASSDAKPGTSPATSASARAATPSIQPSSERVAAVAPAVHVVKAVNLTLSPAATSEVAGDSRFTTGALNDAIRAELKSRGLLDAQNPRADGTAEILVDHLATQPTVNVVLFGRQMMAGTLTGGIRVQGANGSELLDFRLVAESRLAIAVNGEDKNPLGPLYQRFAVLAADRLAGVESKPVVVSADGQPRS